MQHATGPGLPTGQVGRWSIAHLAVFFRAFGASRGHLVSWLVPDVANAALRSWTAPQFAAFHAAAAVVVIWLCPVSSIGSISLWCHRRDIKVARTLVPPFLLQQARLIQSLAFPMHSHLSFNGCPLSRFSSDALPFPILSCYAYSLVLQDRVIACAALTLLLHWFKYKCITWAE